MYAGLFMFSIYIYMYAHIYMYTHTHTNMHTIANSSYIKNFYNFLNTEKIFGAIGVKEHLIFQNALLCYILIKLPVLIFQLDFFLRGKKVFTV